MPAGRSGHRLCRVFVRPLLFSAAGVQACSNLIIALPGKNVELVSNQGRRRIA